MSKLPYYCNCVGWRRDMIDVLTYLQENDRQITRRTFRKHVNTETLRRIELEELQYFAHGAQGLTMAGDWHVSYHKCEGIYYFSHSGIEYVFATLDQLEALAKKIRNTLYHQPYYDEVREEERAIEESNERTEIEREEFYKNTMVTYGEDD